MQIQNPKSKIQNEELILAENGFYWRTSGAVKILTCRALEEKGFVNGFSTRLGGVSDFPKNSLNLSGFDIDSPENIAEKRRRFLQVLGSNFQIATVWQVHGCEVKIVREISDVDGANEKFDALASNMPNVLVGVKTADCVPVLLGDAKTKSFAAIHAGWRGSAQSIVAKTIEKMRAEFGVEARNLTAAIGAAAICDYEIGQDVIDAFAENFPDSENLFTPTRDGHAFVDLHSANRRQLLSAGILDENIFTAPLCTMENNDLFFSYRRDRKIYGKTGRLLSVIGRKDIE
ncbi:MAG: peptidoglycan editing factor PgeF [Pyrinomonadaceae bacterium]